MGVGWEGTCLAPVLGDSSGEDLDGNLVQLPKSLGMTRGPSNSEVHLTSLGMGTCCLNSCGSGGVLVWQRARERGGDGGVLVRRSARERGGGGLIRWCARKMAATAWFGGARGDAAAAAASWSGGAPGTARPRRR